MELIRKDMCYHLPTCRKFVSRDVTFFESVHLFSSDRTSLQGEYRMGEELSLVSLPMPVPISYFDGDGGNQENDSKRNCKEGQKELKCYS